MANGGTLEHLFRSWGSLYPSLVMQIHTRTSPQEFVSIVERKDAWLGEIKQRLILLLQQANEHVLARN